MRSQQGVGPDIDEAGFSLVEVMVALGIIVVLAISTAPLFTNALRHTAGLGTRQSALTVASQRLEYARSVDPSALVTNRAQADVATLTASPGLVNLSQDVTLPAANAPLLNYDPIPAGGNSNQAIVKLLETQVLNNVAFTIRTFIDPCFLSRSTGACTTSPANGAPAYRISVDVAWPKPAVESCASARLNQCEYVVTTLADPSGDPIFTSNALPAISSIASAPQQVGSSPVTVHPGQQVTLTVTGNNFVNGIGLTSKDSADVVGPVTYPSANSLSTTFMAATTPVLGTHTLVVTNPDGGTAYTSVTVANSAPTISAETPGSSARGATVTFTLTGSDFYAPSPLPTSLGTVTLGAGTVVMTGYPNSSYTPTYTNEVVTSPTTITFQTTLPSAPAAYTFTGTVVVTNPDGVASAAGSFSVAVS